MENNSTTPRILVGVDGSDHSIGALHAAAEVAAAMNAHIRAVTVWEYPAMFYPVQHWTPARDAKSLLIATLKKAFGTKPPDDLDTQILCGYAPRVLINESRDADMLVLGSRGHGGFTGLLLGSVSAACAQHAHCPVLITHDDDPSRGPRDPRELAARSAASR